MQSLWRNGLARWTSNSKVVGSSPTRDVFLLITQKTTDPTYKDYRILLCTYNQIYAHDYGMAGF